MICSWHFLKDTKVNACMCKQVFCVLSRYQLINQIVRKKMKLETLQENCNHITTLINSKGEETS